MTLNRVIFVGSFIALSSLAEYVPGTYGVLFLRQIEGVTYYKSPGTPGSVWTKEETEIVRKKVIELMRYSNWSPDTRDGLFWTDGTLDGSRGISWVEEKWCKVRSIRKINDLYICIYRTVLGASRTLARTRCPTPPSCSGSPSMTVLPT